MSIEPPREGWRRISNPPKITQLYIDRARSPLDSRLRGKDASAKCFPGRALDLSQHAIDQLGETVRVFNFGVTLAALAFLLLKLGEGRLGRRRSW